MERDLNIFVLPSSSSLSPFSDGLGQAMQKILFFLCYLCRPHSLFDHGRRMIISHFFAAEQEREIGEREVRRKKKKEEEEEEKNPF